MTENIKQDKKITKEMTIREVIGQYPDLSSVLMGLGLHCVGCPLAQGETVEEAAKVHNMDLENLLQTLNKAIKE